MWKWDKGTIHHFFILKSLASEIPNLPIIKRASPCWLCLLDLLSLPICNIRASWDSTLSLLSKHTCPPGGIFQFCGLRYCYTFTTLKCVSRPRYFLELRIPLSTDYPKTLLRILIDMSDIVCPNWSHNSITLLKTRKVHTLLSQWQYHSPVCQPQTLPVNLDSSLSSTPHVLHDISKFPWLYHQNKSSSWSPLPPPLYRHPDPRQHYGPTGLHSRCAQTTAVSLKWTLE